jgi:hypothetical protein
MVDQVPALDPLPERPPASTSVAIGRPVVPRHPLAALFLIPARPSQKPCFICGAATWFGPRLAAVIDEIGLLPGCADCLVEQLLAGAEPLGIFELQDLAPPQAGVGL